jgi:hypothetical protein
MASYIVPFHPQIRHEIFVVFGMKVAEGEDLNL